MQTQQWAEHRFNTRERANHVGVQKKRLGIARRCRLGFGGGNADGGPRGVGLCDELGHHNRVGDVALNYPATCARTGGSDSRLPHTFSDSRTVHGVLGALAPLAVHEAWRPMNPAPPVTETEWIKP